MNFPPRYMVVRAGPYRHSPPKPSATSADLPSWPVEGPSGARARRGLGPAGRPPRSFQLRPGRHGYASRGTAGARDSGTKRSPNGHERSIKPQVNGQVAHPAMLDVEEVRCQHSGC
jgi:hypothetical protein